MPVVGGAHVIPMTNYTIVSDGYGEKGVKKTYEDEFFICENLKTFNKSLHPNFNFSCFCLIDGHNGKNTATFLKKNLAQELSNSFAANQETYEGTLPIPDHFIRIGVNNACKKIDEKLSVQFPGCRDGATCVIILIKDDYAYIINVGDSSAYLCRFLNNANQAIDLVDIHKPWVLSEKERIIKHGGRIENGRVNDIIDVTRAFGDLMLKKYGLLCTGTFKKFKISPDDNFIIMGTDGFFSFVDVNHITNEIVALSRKEERMVNVEKKKAVFDAKNVCRIMVEHALVDKKSQDNVTVILIKFLHK
ncbi:protein phosphatase PPM7, putative [Plasmodium vivax]|uniref:protein-serine/threonine phosphatase n=6 Tax=Plasmodium vivax TaxID=5855 RepID=A5JZS4_PLAVS|nr:Protein phosphatase 2C containing protein [Plasmodium vivax]KMZ78034.1 protein phosphatase 2C containing protein [Plasmodium vivax India VII]KMZ84374.1 protein phosphatase 2C containing protein [Plasmodium vivax Brazil I]KMZ90154.1 protein phosphatase 2C containing protein [Plasmodium vivax Mauritania I]KMZ96863.1 protein phosphatase 2C containing protein [Plasmodium vivax North Korean]EDL47485.1 Protein phosphatase 2C containing protein [Plasmodium vivax]|eukprot:XP_001617212.1 Protein phosphatase 2C containing protein [Plasmodium vivax Sal-1]